MIVYWDWSLVFGNLFSIVKRESLWYIVNFGFGGDGIGLYSCVQIGLFREVNWSIVLFLVNFLLELGFWCLVWRFNGNFFDFVVV